MLYQTKSYWISTLIFQCTSKRSSFNWRVGGSLKFIYGCPLYYMGGWVRMESDCFGCEGRRGRWNFRLFCGNHKTFTHKKYFKGGKFREVLLYHKYIFSIAYALSPNFFSYTDEVTESFFNFWKWIG